MSKLLDGLNPSQREAVTHKSGPLLIIAGPGSGKTRTVVRSIAYAIENGVQPDRILTFSFTGKACSELRKQVKELIDEEEGDLVQIFTFHGFCRRILRKDIEELRKGYTRNFKELKPQEQKQVVSDQISKVQAQINITLFQHREFLKTKDILDFITRCKLQFIPPSVANEHVPHPEMPPEISRAYVEIYERYERVLEANGWIDYANQLLLANELLRDVPEVKKEWQEKFELIFVDEYQDTDPVQYCIINALADHHENVRVVGDDDQGIYGWRGADIQNILNFEKDYLKAKVISLGQNYRSTQRIVEASRALAAFNPDRREKELFTRNSEGKNIIHLHCENNKTEAITIADFISRAIQKGRNPSDFAVLYRTKKQACTFEEAFVNFKIPYYNVDKTEERFSEQPEHTVSLMTIHKSKGLEFPNVFVVGVCKDLLPLAGNEQNEERRLLYVAMTRAQNWLCLSSYEINTGGDTNGRSPFLDEIPRNLLEPTQFLSDFHIPLKPIKSEKTESSAVVEEPLDSTTLSPIRPEIVLGIDPGNIDADNPNVGWAVTEKSSNGYTIIDCNTETPNGTSDKKLEQIEHQINKLIVSYSPDAIAVEKLEGATDRGLIGVAGCVALVRSIADQHGIERAFYSPQQVKYAATGNRKAKKEQVEAGVKKRCTLPMVQNSNNIDDHSADAIAVSLCYLDSYLNSSRLQWKKRKQEYYDSGLVYLGNGQYDAAIAEFKEAINIDLIYTEAHCELGRASLAQGDLDRSENAAKTALRLAGNNHPDSQKLLDAIECYRSGCNAMNNKQFNEAITEFQESINLELLFMDAHYELSRVHLRLGNLQIAKNVVEEALKLADDHLLIQQLSDAIRLYNAGLNFLNDRHYNDAIDKLNEAIDREPTFTEAHYWLGCAYFQSGALEATEQSANDILELNISHQLARVLLDDIKKAYVDKGDSALERLDLTEAEKCMNKAFYIDKDCQLAHKLSESIKQAYYSHALNHLNNLQYDEAIAAFKETINKYPKFTKAHCGLGQAYFGKGSLAAAEKSAREAPKLEDDYQPALQILDDIRLKHYELGTGYLKQNNLTEAERSANEALRLDDCYQPVLDLLEDIKYAYYNRGCNYLDHQRHDEAIVAFEGTTNKYPKFTKAHCGLGQAYFGKGNLAAAEKSARAALELEDDYQPALQILDDIRQKQWELGRDYLNQDNLAKAEKSANHALRLAPNCQLARALLENIKQAYCNQGCEHLDNQRYDEAIDTFTKTKNKYPDFTEAHYRLAQAYFGQEDLAKAEKSAREALKLEVNYQPALQILKSVKQKHYKDGMSYLERGNLTAAERSANEALRLKPDYPLARALLEDIKQAYYNQGCEHLDNQRYDEAIDTFTKTKNKYPDFAEVHYRLAQVYLEQGDGLAAAEESVKETLRLDPNYQPAHALLEDIKQEYHNRGIARIEVGEYIWAIDLLLKVNSIDPNNKEVCTNLADVYCLMGDDANAASWYQKVTDIDPNDKIAYIELGNAYYNMGKYEKAVDSFEQASKLDLNCEKTHDYWKRADFKLQNDKKMKADRMIRIPAGEFQIGSNGSESKDCENLAHTIYVDEFYIDINPVTNAQYKVFVDKNPEWQKNYIFNWYNRADYLMNWNGNNYPQGKDNHPVTYVDWYAAMAYALWVGKRLPTEVEWEKASREFGDTVLVGNYSPDNASSVWEWCLDEYNSNSNRSFWCPNPIVGADNTDEIINNFKNVTTQRVSRRGGGINRRGNTPSFTNYHYGFRCVRSVTS